MQAQRETRLRQRSKRTGFGPLGVEEAGGVSQPAPYRRAIPITKLLFRPVASHRADLESSIGRAPGRGQARRPAGKRPGSSKSASGRPHSVEISKTWPKPPGRGPCAAASTPSYILPPEDKAGRAIAASASAHQADEINFREYQRLKRSIRCEFGAPRRTLQGGGLHHPPRSRRQTAHEGKAEAVSGS